MLADKLLEPPSLLPPDPAVKPNTFTDLSSFLFLLKLLWVNRLVLFMSCISGGAKSAFVDLIDHLADADPSHTKTLGTLKKSIKAMPICKVGKGTRKASGPRKVSRWQLCIKKERTGKKFDPDAIRKLAVLYKQGKCP